MNMYCDSSSSNDAKVNNNYRFDFGKIFEAALQINFFNFKGKLCKQIDGVVAESSFGKCIFVSMNRLGLMNVLINANQYITKDMLLTYLLCLIT